MPVAGQPSGLAPARPASAPRCELLEQPQLGVAVGLPRAVELEVLVGQVGQDRDVVGDRVDPAERQAVRGRLDDRRGVAGDAHRLHRTLQVGRLRGRGVGLVGGLHAADPRRGGARHAGRDARGLERGHGEERGRRLAVRAGDPDDREGVARVARTTRRRRWPGRTGRHRRPAARRATSGTGRSTSTAAAPACAAASTKSWPSTWSPGTATNSEPARTVRESLVTPLTAMSARPAGPMARPSRRAPRSRCSAASRSMSPPSCGGAGPLGVGQELGDRALGHRLIGPAPCGPRAVPAGSRWDRRRARVRRSARASVRRTRSCAGTGRTGRRLPSVRRGRPRCPRHRDPSPSSLRGSPARSPASAAGAARPGWSRAPRRGRRSGRSRAGRRGGTGSRPASGRRRRSPRASR